MYATNYHNDITPIKDECLTVRRLPVRNPYAAKQSDGTYLYTHASGEIVRYWSKSSLLRRGWTVQMISERLGECDVRTTNPYNVSSPMMELFSADDVEAIERFLNKSPLSVEEAIETGDIEAGIKIQVNTIAFAGVYTSDGRGSWNPSTRNKKQLPVTTNNMMFWYHEGFPMTTINN